MAYDRYDRPRDERYRNEDRYRGGRDDDFDRGGRERGGRGFFERAGDEISSWFGDEEAERRREQDERMSGHGRHDTRGGERGGWFGGSSDRERERERGGWFGNDREDDRSWRASEWNRDRGDQYRQDRGRRDYGGQGYSRSQSEEYRPFAGDYGRGSSERYGRSEPRGVGAGSAFAGASAATSRNFDPHYQEWRQRQIDQLDQDYQEYRREHQSKFDNDFSGWRSQRQGKRQLLGQVRDHMDVVGSDEQLLGKVDKVQGDRIILTRDSMGGVHKSLGCGAVDRIEGDRVILSQSADEARRDLREERGFRERNERDQRGFIAQDRQQRTEQSDGPHILERSFSGTYPDDANR